ncbi:MAG: RNA polymerase sigma factor, partial [Planctomycetota bacterium JB042]
MEEPASTSSDDSLAAAAAEGARPAFEQLVGRYGGPVLAVVEKQVGDHHAALDLAQEIWIKVFRALPRYRPGGSFRSWIFSITLNHVRDARRKQQRSPVVDK